MTIVESSNLQLSQDGELVSHEGRLFTGTSVEHGSGGTLIAEVEFADGVRHGRSRYWSKEGVLISDGMIRQGFAVGRLRQWFDNGSRKRDGMFEHGICVAEKQWDETGKLTRDFTLTESDHMYRVLQGLRASYRG